MSRKSTYLTTSASLILAMFATVTNAALDTDIKVAIEEPFAEFPATGISSIRGWAVGPDGIAKVELYINGVYKKDLPFPGTRGDVYSNLHGQYPTYPDLGMSGFATAQNFNLLDDGQNTITVRAISRNNVDYNEASVTFTVDSFHFNWSGNENALALGAASFSAVGNDLRVQNAYVDNQPYDLTFRWSRGSQAPELYAIDTASSSSALRVAGTWDMFSEMDASDCGSGKEAARQEMIFTQSGNTVNFDGEVTGALVGSRLTLTENYSDGGDALVMNWVFDFNNDATFLQGAGSWIWTSNGATCEGSTSLLGRRIQ